MIPDSRLVGGFSAAVRLREGGRALTKIYFEELMAEFGAHAVDNVAFAEAADYPYSAELTQPGDSPQLQFRFVVDGSAKPAAAALKEKDVAFCEWFAEKGAAGFSLVCLFSPPSDFYAKSGIHTLLKAAEAAMRTASLRPPENCPLCGLARCDVNAMLDGGYRKSHAACLASRLTLPQEDERPEKRPRGYIASGIAGALVGALIGALPNWAGALSAGRINAPMYVFIPLLAALCYRLFRGRASSLVSGISVLASSLLAAFSLEQVWYWLVVSGLAGRNVSFAESVVLYFRSHTLISTLGEMLMPLIFLIVGYVVGTLILRRYNHSGEETPPVIRGAAFVRASAAPIGEKKPAHDEPPAATGSHDDDQHDKPDSNPDAPSEPV